MLQWLMTNAHQVSIDCNQHRCSYETVERTIQDNPERFSDLTAEERAELIAHNSVCVLQLYPDTPVGFVLFIHWDPDVCVERACQWLRKERGEQCENTGTPRGCLCGRCDG